MATQVITETNAQANTAGLLKYRIEAEIKALNGHLPERYALAWHGYLACAIEWGVIHHTSYGQLIKMLPELAKPDPIETILLGREEDDEKF